MKISEIKNLIKNVCKKNNIICHLNDENCKENILNTKKNPKIKLEVKVNHYLENKADIYYWQDFRLQEHIFKEHILSLYLYDNDRQKILGSSTIFIIPSSIIKGISFWQYDSNIHALKNISLADLLPKSISSVLTFGFTRSKLTAKNIPLISLALIKLYRQVIQQTGGIAYFETTGTANLNREQMDENILRLDNVDSSLQQEQLGLTSSESLAIESASKLFKFRQLSDIYNKRTLGKVFVNANFYQHCISQKE